MTTEPTKPASAGEVLYEVTKPCLGNTLPWSQISYVPQSVFEAQAQAVISWHLANQPAPADMHDQVVKFNEIIPSSTKLLEVYDRHAATRIQRMTEVRSVIIDSLLQTRPLAHNPAPAYAGEVPSVEHLMVHYEKAFNESAASGNDARWSGISAVREAILRAMPSYIHERMEQAKKVDVARAEKAGASYVAANILLEKAEQQIEALTKELKPWQALILCPDCGLSFLSACGDQDEDGEPSMDCQVCRLRAQLSLAKAEAGKTTEFPRCETCGSSAWMCGTCAINQSPIPQKAPEKQGEENSCGVCGMSYRAIYHPSSNRRGCGCGPYGKPEPLAQPVSLACGGECGNAHGGRNCDAKHKGWKCTLIEGHSGPHVACGHLEHAYAQWPNEADTPSPTPAVAWVPKMGETVRIKKTGEECEVMILKEHQPLRPAVILRWHGLTPYDLSEIEPLPQPATPTLVPLEKGADHQMVVKAAYVAGKRIQCRHVAESYREWMDCTGEPQWAYDFNYRIHPDDVEAKIITSHVKPPIPLRNWDWSALRDGNEETGPVGWGRTEAAAIADLKSQEEESNA